MRPPSELPNPSDRFYLATDQIDTRRLERETDRLLAVGLLVAIVVQACVFLAFPHQRPLPADPIGIPMSFRITPPRRLQPFVIHAPVTNRVESLRKQYTPGQPREFESRRPDMLDISVGEMPIYDIDDTTALNIGNIIAFVDSFGFAPVELPDAVAEYIRRKRDDEIFLHDDLLTIDDFATNDSRYMGLVIYNPGDPMSITGVVAFGRVFDYRYADVSNGIVGLSYSVNSLSDIRTRMVKPIDYNRSASEKMPFVYIGTEDLFEYTPVEIAWFRNYIEHGGFIVLENQYYVAEVTPAEASLKQFVRELFGSQARFSPLLHEHPLYHCYFHFDDGPPIEAKIINPITGEEMQLPIEYIEGIYVDGRMVGIYSNKGWGRAWGDWGGTSPMHRIGVNMLVYALRNAEKAERYTDPTLARGPNGSYAAEYQMFSQYGTK